jgi:transcription antitermination protein NusB
MASNRHLGRIVILQTLYEWDFRNECGDTDAVVSEILKRNLARYKDTIDDTKFIDETTMGVVAVRDEMDAVIVPVAPEWPIDQIARIDRNILRLAVYELTELRETPPKVIINEAVELAKAFGGDNSSKFINGVLGTVYRSHYEVVEAKPEVVKKVTKKKAEKVVEKA